MRCMLLKEVEWKYKITRTNNHANQKSVIKKKEGTRKKLNSKILYKWETKRSHISQTIDEKNCLERVLSV